MVTLRQLRYLEALAETLHFGQAAEACAVTQPALSMQIKALEDELQVSLIERRKSGVELTEQTPLKATYERTCGMPARSSGTITLSQWVGTVNRGSTRTSVPARSAVDAA